MIESSDVTITSPLFVTPEERLSEYVNSFMMGIHDKQKIMWPNHLSKDVCTPTPTMHFRSCMLGVPGFPELIQ